MLKKWINEPKAIREEGNLIEIVAGSKTNYFVDPVSESKSHSAPIYVEEAGRDFTFKCKVTAHLNCVYDAGAIMVYINENNWVKFALENTDMGHKSVISVVTDGYSDDSNGERIFEETIWMKVSRKDKIFGLYYSLDSIVWKMVRVFKHRIEDEDKVYIGLEVQSPHGEECMVEFRDVDYDKECVNCFRKGV